jgi:hypothetical protein
MLIKGPLEEYFETGTEGVYWSIYDETKLPDKEGQYRSYDGLHIIRPGQHLAILYDGAEIWKGDPGLIGTWEAKKHKYFKQYVKTQHLCTQLSFGGMWIHYIPTNVDLGLWYRVFFSDSGKFTGILDIREEE